MLSVSITILTVLLVVVSFLMILLVLMQRPKQEGLGAAFGGGMMNDIAGAHTTDILQKGTVWLAVMFFSISIVLGVLYTREISGKKNMKVLENVKPELPAERPLPSISEFPLPTPVEGTPVEGTPVEGTPAPTEGAPAETAPTPASVPGEGGAADGETSPKPANGETAPAEAPAPAPAPEAGKDQPSGDPPESSESKPGEPGEDKKPAESGTTPQ